MLAEETVDFEVLSEDDFGIRKIGLEWSGEFTRATDEVPAKGELKLLDGGRKKWEAENRPLNNRAPEYAATTYRVGKVNTALRARLHEL